MPPARKSAGLSIRSASCEHRPRWGKGYAAQMRRARIHFSNPLTTNRSQPLPPALLSGLSGEPDRSMWGPRGCAASRTVDRTRGRNTRSNLSRVPGADLASVTAWENKLENPGRNFLIKLIPRRPRKATWRESRLCYQPLYLWGRAVPRTSVEEKSASAQRTAQNRALQ